MLADVDADEVPELLVVNKVDPAEPEDMLQLRSGWPDAVFVSAHTGEGIDKLRAAIEQALPQPHTTLTVCIPYVRGDLVSRMRSRGEVLTTEHRGDGSVITARVDDALAGELRAFVLEKD